MKCAGISVGSSSKDARTFEQFIESPQAESPLGELFIALVKETAWSSAYEVYASIDGESSWLTIYHKTLLPDRSLAIPRDTGQVLSVQEVEKAVRAHLKNCEKSIWPIVSILQDRAHTLQRALEDIDTDKAKAAIVAAFPEVIHDNLFLIEAENTELFAFHAKGNNEGPIFAVRKIGDEFTGGVARINCTVPHWLFKTQYGILAYQRLGMFWIALARAFVVRELKLLRGSPYCQSIFASGNTVEKIVLGMEGRDAVVTFENDLPVSVVVVDPE